MTCTYTANAGFLLACGSVAVAVDAFPRQEARGFSALAAADFESLLQDDFTGRRLYAIATHDHPDHYSRANTSAFLAAHPQSCFLGAVNQKRLPLSKEGGAIRLTGERPTYYFQGVTFEFARLAHEGEEFSDIPNYGCLITFAGTPARRALFLGDAKPADPAVADWLAERPIDLALLNFPWICLPKGRRFLDETVAPGRIAVLHLPYEADDRSHYLKVTRKAAAAYRPQDTVLLTAFGQSFSW